MNWTAFFVLALWQFSALAQPAPTESIPTKEDFMTRVRAALGDFMHDNENIDQMIDDTTGQTPPNATSLQENYNDIIAHIQNAQTILNDFKELNHTLTTAEGRQMRLLDQYLQLFQGEQVQEALNKIKTGLEMAQSTPNSSSILERVIEWFKEIDTTISNTIHEGIESIKTTISGPQPTQPRQITMDEDARRAADQKSYEEERRYQASEDFRMW